MSPQDVPTSFQDYQHHGSLFTLFLHSPLTAVCYICNVGDVPIHHWERCQGYVEKFVTEASCLFTRCRVEDVGKNRDYIGERCFSSYVFIFVRNLMRQLICLFHILFRLFLLASPHDIDSAYLQFFGDDFLRTILLRYIFCDVVLRIHMSFRGRHQRPRCEPPLPADLLEHPSLSHIVLQLASALDVRDQFHETATEIEWFQPTESDQNEPIVFDRVCLFVCLIGALYAKQATRLLYICIRYIANIGSNKYYHHVRANLINHYIDRTSTSSMPMSTLIHIEWLLRITFTWCKSCWSLLPPSPPPLLLHRCRCNHHLSLISFSLRHIRWDTWQFC